MTELLSINSSKSHLFSRYSLPLRSTAALHQRRHSLPKEICALRDIYDVKDHPLIRLYIIHGEVKPQT